MVDYNQRIPNNGELMIRDLGFQVQFWFKSDDGATFSYGGFGWHGYVNGVGVGGTSAAYPPGTGWMHVASYDVAYGQNVEFGLNDTGTYGLNGYSNMSASISRAVRPSAPGTPTFTNPGPTSVTVSWSASTSNGGSAIDGYLLRYWPNAAGTGSYVDHSQSNNTSRTVSGLVPGNSYRFVVYAHNGSADNSGYSNSSPAAVYLAAGVVRIHVDGTYKMAIPYVHTDGQYRLAVPYVHSDGAYKLTG